MTAPHIRRVAIVAASFLLLPTQLAPSVALACEGPAKEILIEGSTTFKQKESHILTIRYDAAAGAGTEKVETGKFSLKELNFKVLSGNKCYETRTYTEGEGCGVDIECITGARMEKFEVLPQFLPKVEVTLKC